jgi:hypothetical protein
MEMALDEGSPFTCKGEIDHSFLADGSSRDGRGTGVQLEGQDARHPP